MTEIQPDTDNNENNTSFELEQVDIYGQFMLTSRTEILFILRSLSKHGVLATLYFDHNKSFLLTTILDVVDTKNEIILDPGSDAHVNQRALQADSFTVTGSLDKVKIQFRLKGLRSCTYEGRPAFAAHFPEALLRLQRREYFRLETPIANPVRCYLVATLENDTPQPIDFPLLDISGGGISLMAPLNAQEFLAVGALFQNCRIDLPGEGPIVVNLCIRGIFRVMPRNGNEYLRIGCEFINLPNGRLTLIQRYITRVERERKAKLSGML